MATKVFFYTLRPYDELGIAQRLAPQLDVEFGSTQEYPRWKMLNWQRAMMPCR